MNEGAGPSRVDFARFNFHVPVSGVAAHAAVAQISKARIFMTEDRNTAGMLPARWRVLKQFLSALFYWKFTQFTSLCNERGLRSGMTVAGAFRHLVRHPVDSLVRRWNWKSAVLSPLFRSQIFLAVNLRAGWKAALGAMAAEFAYRSLAAGFCGALTQAFRGAEPAWMAGLAVAVLLPLVSHSIELLIHWLRGTPNLWASMAASVIFTAISTVFNWYAMRKGVFVVGEGSATLAADLRRIPRILFEFVILGPVTLWRICARPVLVASRMIGAFITSMPADSAND